MPDTIEDIVTCSQSLHWMDPDLNFKDAARILHSGGVFAAFDYDWPPAIGCWEAEMEYAERMKSITILEAGLVPDNPPPR